MHITRLYRITGIFAIILPLLSAALFMTLQTVFDFPGILREPVGVALSLFAQNQDAIIPAYYLFAWTGILFIPLVILLHQIMEQKTSIVLNIATVLGIIAGVVQFLGFIRWPFMIPSLAQAYIDPAAANSMKEAISVTYNAFNLYAGGAIGEHLGYVFQSGWGIMFATVLLNLRFGPRLLAWFGILMSVALFISGYEQLIPSQAEALASLNLVAVIGWQVWLLVMGVVLLLKRPTVQSPLSYSN